MSVCGVMSPCGGEPYWTLWLHFWAYGQDTAVVPGQIGVSVGRAEPEQVEASRFSLYTLI